MAAIKQKGVGAETTNGQGDRRKDELGKMMPTRQSSGRACGKLPRSLSMPAMVKKQPKRIERPGVDRMGRTPLHYAVADGNEPDVLRLLSEGADVNARDDDGWSPLHFATQANSAALASRLLSAGAEVDALDANGNSPLSNAVFNYRGDGQLIAVLRLAGANPHAGNKYGVSPIGLARTISNYDVARHFNDLP